MKKQKNTLSHANMHEDEISRMRYRKAIRKHMEHSDEFENTVEEYELEEDEMYMTPNRKRKRKRRLLPILVICLLLTTVSFGGYQYLSTLETGVWTVAVFGVDSRDGNTGKGSLADVQMIASINRETGDVNVISIYRDTYVNMGDDDYHKVNDAYLKGGSDLAIEVLNNNLDIAIDDYATFNWKAVAEGINILGGIELEITQPEFEYINSFITETVESTGVGSVHLTQPGYQRLDGVQAVAYARLRLMDTDFQRTNRQQKVIELAIEKAKLADISTLNTLVINTFAQVSTSMGINDILSMVKGIEKYNISNTAGFPFQYEVTNIDSRSCVVPANLTSNVIALHQFLYLNEDYVISESIKHISDDIEWLSGVGNKGSIVLTDE